MSWSLAELETEAVSPIERPQLGDQEDLPYETKSTHTDRLEVSVSVAMSAIVIVAGRSRAQSAGLVNYLLVISKVVPKICARTNSAIVDGRAPVDANKGCRGCFDTDAVVVVDAVRLFGQESGMVG